MLQQRMSAFYNSQCCGLAFEYQTLQLRRAQRLDARCRRPPLLPVVHARRARQLLAVQRRDERRAALAPDCPMSSVDSRHRRRRLRGQPPARPARATHGARRRRVAPTRRHGARTARRRTSRWEAVDLLDRDGRARRRSRACGRRPSITAPAPRTSASRGDTTERDVRHQRARHPPPARRARRARASRRACSFRARRWSTRRSNEALDRRRTRSCRRARTA